MLWRVSCARWWRLVACAAPPRPRPDITIGPTARRRRCSTTSRRSASASTSRSPGSTRTATASPTGSRSRSCARPGRARACKVPAIVDASPYYTTVCRGNEGECIGDLDGDGRNDRWPLFYDNYFVPRGYAYVLAEMNGTGNSTGCPLHGGAGDIAGHEVGDRLAQRPRPPATRRARAATPVTADWHNGSAAMIGKSYDGTLANGVAATGVEGLEDDRADLGDLGLVPLLAHERGPVQHELPVVALQHGHERRAQAPCARRRGRR